MVLWFANFVVGFDRKRRPLDTHDASVGCEQGEIAVH